MRSWTSRTPRYLSAHADIGGGAFSPSVFVGIDEDMVQDFARLYSPAALQVKKGDKHYGF